MRRRLLSLLAGGLGQGDFALAVRAMPSAAQIGGLDREFAAAMVNDFDVPAAMDALDRAATRVNAGTATPGEAAALRAALATLGFAFAGARGPANGDLKP